jgi:glycosyltransferase involved in cell wall biosynthesis
VYRLGTAGYGGTGSRRFPWPDYRLNIVDNWLLPELPQIAADFSGDEELTIMFIWDLSRLGWFADPRQCPNAHIRQWLETTKLRKWVYHALDAEGPFGKLSTRLAEIYKGFNRVLDYSDFSCCITGNTEHLPHGIDTSVFKPQDRKESKHKFCELGFHELKDNDFLVGIVATNQARKDWALGIQACRILLERGLDVKVWCHTDTLERFWSLPNLIADYRLQGRVVITTAHFTDEQMAQFYSACDVTLGIGLGEGFGYPIFESLACGTPCVHGAYGGAEKHLPPSMKVFPLRSTSGVTAFRYEGLYCCKRPVYDAEEWAERAIECSKVYARPIRPALPLGLDWNNLWPRWEAWLRKDSPKTITLDTVRELNYDHHRRMTIDHEKGGQAAAVQIKSKDDDSYRALLSNVPHGGKILELGSAWGGQWNALREWSDDLTGIDLYEPAVTKSRAEGKNIYLGFVEKIPFPDESFDLVCSRHVMEHVSDIQIALTEIKRVLKPGGIVAAVTPHRFPDYEPAHIQQLRIDEWVKEYGKSGFEIVSFDIREYECVEAHVIARKPG